MIQEVIIVVEITCSGRTMTKQVDVMQIGGPFDRGMAMNELRKMHPGCDIRLVGVEWVVARKN